MVQDLMLKETELLLNYEMKLLNKNILPFDLENDLMTYLKFISSRIMTNVAVLHKNKGIHNQLTTQNLTLDGKFIDYDTLEWITDKDEFETKRKSEMKKLNSNLEFFLCDILKIGKNENFQELSKKIIDEVNEVYQELYNGGIKI